MAQHAERVHTRPQEIQRLEDLCATLQEETRVVVTLANGSRVSGVVPAKPGLQTFIDRDGNEGVNAVLKLDDIGGMGVIRYFWLDDVRAVSPQPLDPPAG